MLRQWVHWRSRAGEAEEHGEVVALPTSKRQSESALANWRDRYLKESLRDGLRLVADGLLRKVIMAPCGESPKGRPMRAERTIECVCIFHSIIFEKRIKIPPR